MAADRRDYGSAVSDFWRARRRANLREVARTLARSNHPLMNFEDVRRKLRAVESPQQQLVEVPLDAIVGSVGRYNDFTREFLPRQDSDEGRWAGVRLAMTGDIGVPPIELYRIGDAYFVKDGNHRVSVARQLGNRVIQAYVTPLTTRVPLAPNTSPDELIIKAEYADFLEATRLDELRRGADLTVTVPGQYERLLEHIVDHRYYMGLDEERDITWEEAVTHWYDVVYLPAVEAIERHGLLSGFEGRTATDAYLWLGEHRGKLWRDLGFSLPPETIAGGMARAAALTPAGRQKLLDEARTGAADAALYRDILVGLPGAEPKAGRTAGAPVGPEAEPGVAAFHQALALARREHARLYVLQIVTGGSGPQRAAAEHLQGELAGLAATAGVAAQFVFDEGRPVEELLERSTWSDLVVVPNHPTLRGLVRRCRRPLLLAGGTTASMRHLLLAFDGGRRSEEAMFHAAWLCLTAGAQLVVATVAATDTAGERVLDKARAYLEANGVEATYLVERGGIAERLVAAAEAHGCDTIMLGSYKYSAWLETVLGGVPDEVIGRAEQNVFIV